MNGRSTRIALLGALTLAAGACANILGFENFDLGSDASPDVTIGVEGDDATVEEAAPPPSTVDASIDAADSGSPNEAAAARDVVDAAPEIDSPCATGETLCNGQCTDTSRDNNHCGGCDVACLGDNLSCVGSVCTCATNFHLCFGQCASNFSANSCGTTSCTPCVAPLNAISNACTDAGCGLCPPTLTLCNANTPAAECVDTTSDPANCGACGAACHVPDAGGTTSCMASNCVISCTTGFTACPTILPTSCANLTNDIHNCGACSKKCPAHDGGAAATCVDGGCH